MIVNAGGNLQAAIDAARPGDTIDLEAGATFSGNYVLPATDGTAPITLRTAGTLPPGLVALDAPLATVRTPNSTPALRTYGNAARWTCDGVRFAAGSSQGDIVALGDGVTADAAQLPRSLTIERCLVQADATAKNGIVINCADTTIRHCRITGIKLQGVESHAIVGYNGPGPFLIEDNCLEAGSIGILIGGAAPAVPGLIPSDIVVQRNTITRPLALRQQTGWAIKNLFELKNAQRVTIRGNVFEHNWPDGQAGFAIVFTVRANSANAPWSTVRDVLFECNTIRHVAMGFNILGIDDAAPSQPMERVTIRNTLVYDLDRVNWKGPTGQMGSGIFAGISGAPRYLTIERSTVVGAVTGNICNFSGQPIPGLVITRNLLQKVITPYQTYGMNGDAVGEGNPAFARYAPPVAGYPDFVCTDNVLAGCTPATYSTQPNNHFPTVATLTANYVDPAADNYRLVPASPYTGLGVDHDALEAARVPPVTPVPPTPSTPAEIIIAVAEEQLALCAAIGGDVSPQDAGRGAIISYRDALLAVIAPTPQTHHHHHHHGHVCPPS